MHSRTRNVILSSYAICAFAASLCFGQFAQSGEVAEFVLFQPVAAVAFRGGDVFYAEPSTNFTGAVSHAVAVYCVPGPDERSWRDSDVTKLLSLNGLAYLELHSDDITDDAIVCLSQAKSLRGLCLSGRQLTQGGIERLKLFPCLEELALSVGWQPGGAEPSIDEAAISSLSVMKKLRRLSVIGTYVKGDLLRAVAKCTAVRSLALTADPAIPGDLNKLRDMKELEELYLQDQTLADDDWAALAALPKLRSLVLQNCDGIAASGKKYLPLMTNLSEFGIPNSDDRDDELLGTLAKMKTLKKLDLSCSGLTGMKAYKVTNDGLRLLGGMTQLKTLIIRNCGQMDDRLLSYVSKLEGLEYLNLSGCASITGAGLINIGSLKSLRGFILCSTGRHAETRQLDVELAHFLTLGNLRYLCLAYCRKIKCEANVGDSKRSKLREVDFRGCEEFPDQALKWLAGCSSLVRIDFSDCRWVQDSTVIVLSQLPEVFEFKLWNCRSVTDGAISGFVKMAKLKRLALRGTSVTVDEAAKFERLRPDCLVF